MIVEAQQQIVAAWLVLGAGLLGLGLLARRLCGARVRRASDLWLSFWVGWGVLLSGLQLWHCFQPVNDDARLTFAAIGGIGLVVGVAGCWRVVLRALPRNLPVLAALAVCVLWLSNQSLGGPRFGDTGMYLIPTVHWFESYAIVPGLANVFVPLGHNQSYFLYVALLNWGPFVRLPYPIVNSILFLALFARGLLGLGRLLGRRPTSLPADLFYALSLIPLVDMVYGVFLTSPAADVPVYLLGLVLAGELIALTSAAKPQRADLLSLVFVAASAMTIKLSVGGIAGVSMAIAFLWWLWRRRPGFGEFASTTTFAVLLVLVSFGGWVGRNLVVSGCPLYPSKIGALDVPWVSKADAIGWIQKPMTMAPLSSIFQQPQWWRVRLESLGWGEREALEPLLACAVALALLLVARPWQWWRGRRALLPALILLPPLVGFVFCFLNTPMPRYQGSTMWVLAFEMLVLALAGPLQRGRWLGRAVLTVLILVAAAAPLTRGQQLWLRLRDFERPAEGRYETRQLPSGLTVSVPSGQTCWYAPLPCTPEPDPGLTLREPGNLAAGFVIAPTLSN